ncbi:MAG TPA: primase-like DNA-binding domain-containing protein, partial [Flavisolibacter sp.]|nr:primase-like DNA-binding domain-containing protein [Flavisolibacter sp.]
RKESDTVHMFIDDEGYCKDMNHEIALKTIYEHYRLYCNETGSKASPSKTFGERLRKLGFEMIRKNKGFFVYVSKNSFVAASRDTLATPEVMLQVNV